MIKVVVKRSGVAKEMSPDDVKVGDIVKVSTGGIVPADGIIVSSEG